MALTFNVTKIPQDEIITTTFSKTILEYSAKVISTSWPLKCMDNGVLCYLLFLLVVLLHFLLIRGSDDSYE